MLNTEPEHTLHDKAFIHVAAGVITNHKNQVLIAKRPNHLHKGGLWEFPGGKVEKGETVFIALQRELREEVNLEIHSAEPLIQIPWHYKDKSVLLNVLRVNDYSGDARGLEGQLVRWVDQHELDGFDFPEANRSITTSLNLPHSYMITGQFVDEADFEKKLLHQLRKGVRLVQLRIKDQNKNIVEGYLKLAKQSCDKYGAKLTVNHQIELAKKYNIGVHLSSQQLMSLPQRPLDESYLVAASVHNTRELSQANKLGIDFIVVSPVNKTASHPDARPIGWQGFSELVKHSTIPAYALGGMSLEDIEQAVMHGGQGIATISELWG